jgi:hypothetical protein
MGFLQHARKVHDSTRSLIDRHRSFRSCISSYCWLIQQSYQSTYIRFANAFGFSRLDQLTEERLISALDALIQERERFLERLLGFSRHRIWQKAAKKRCTSPNETEALYRTDFFVVE